MQIRVWLGGLVLSCLSVPLSLAQSEPGAELTQGAEIRYVELKPTFVTNYGVSSSGHMRYIKADVTVRVGNRNGEYFVRYHLPALRDSLVLLLSRQDDSTVASAAGREVIKAEAIGELTEVLMREEGEAVIEDLMFTNFVVQR